MLKFFWNGIKDSDGKLQRADYSGGPWLNLPSDCITIYGKRYRSFSAEVQAAFKVENGTDFQTDYFENDRIRVWSSHPLFAEVKAALAKQDAHRATIRLRRAA